VTRATLALALALLASAFAGCASVPHPTHEVLFRRFVIQVSCNGTNPWTPVRPVPNDELLLYSLTGIVRSSGTITRVLAEVFVGARPDGTNSDDGAGDNHTAPLLTMNAVLVRTPGIPLGGWLRLQDRRNLHVYGTCTGGGIAFLDIGIYYALMPPARTE
jgi:hypothetical protein